jgi:hypothetical protein
MKNSSCYRVALSCFGLLFVAVVPIAHAEFKCDRPQLARVDATACAKAAESATALRRYVTRTRMIYNLQMSDYARFEGDEPKARPAWALQANPQDSVAKVAPR